MIDHKNIDEAILAITTEGDLYIQKTKKNTGVGYKYAAEGDYLEKMRPKLAEHGIICTPSYRVVDSSVTIMKPSDGKESAKILRLVLMEGTFTWTHAPSGTHRITGAIGEGADNQDKASYKAMTGAQKYAIKQAFHIETGDDPEKDDEPEQQQPAVHPFIADYNLEFDRIGKAAVRRVHIALSIEPEASPTALLDSLAKDMKRALIAALRAEPPF